MAAHAVRRVQRVIIADVTGHAGRRRWRSVRACQRETRDAVIERSRVPALGGVARRAIGHRKSWAGRGVRRVIRLLPGRQVALRVPAIRGLDGQVVIVVDVAGSAGHVGVPVGQQETRGAVVKDRRGPGNRVMARRALGHRKSRTRRRVHRIVGLLPGGQVALPVAAVKRLDLEIVVVADVAGNAGHIRVAIGQREKDRRASVVEARSIERGC